MDDKAARQIVAVVRVLAQFRPQGVPLVHHPRVVHHEHRLARRERARGEDPEPVNFRLADVDGRHQKK
jgi:hypothetical protein